jgi:hypothetical protein
MEKAIIHVRVQYDAVNRTFKLVDRESRTPLEGDGLYDLSLPVVMYNEADVKNSSRRETLLSRTLER